MHERVYQHEGGSPCDTSDDNGATWHFSQALDVYIQHLYNLTLSQTGSGSVSMSPTGYGTNGVFIEQTNVQLTASPSAGWVFSGFSGDAAGGSPTSVFMNGHKSAHATFTALPPIASISASPTSGEAPLSSTISWSTTYMDSVTVTNGSGTVVSNAASGSRLINVSTRGFVGTGSDLMIACTVVTQGSTEARPSFRPTNLSEFIQY